MPGAYEGSSQGGQLSPAGMPAGAHAPEGRALERRVLEVRLSNAEAIEDHPVKDGPAGIRTKRHRHERRA